jgi:hypothetical protein
VLAAGSEARAPRRHNCPETPTCARAGCHRGVGRACGAPPRRVPAARTARACTGGAF